MIADLFLKDKKWGSLLSFTPTVDTGALPSNSLFFLFLQICEFQCICLQEHSIQARPNACMSIQIVTITCYNNTTNSRMWPQVGKMHM